MNQPLTLDIVIVGVGGQGTLLASKIIGHLAVRLGYDVKVSEVHGMSQRGGSVITYLRLGTDVHAPLVEQQGADYILAFEQLEALRVLPYLKDTGCLIVNTQRILPLPVIIGAAEYPGDIISDFQDSGVDIIAANALSMAVEAGNQRAVNTVLLGILANKLPFEKEDWLAAIREVVPQRFADVNLTAFESGYSFSGR